MYKSSKVVMSGVVGGTMVRVGVGVCSAAVLLGLLTGCRRETEATTPTPPAGATDQNRQQESAEARALIARSQEFYRGLEQVQARMATSITSPGESSTNRMMLAAQRPNRIAIEFAEGEALDYALVSDGETLHQYLGGPLNFYRADESPADYSKIMIAAKLGHEDRGGPMAHVLSPHMLGLGMLSGDLLTALVESSDQVVSVGRETLSGVPHQHVRLVSSSINFDIWIVEGEHPWVSRIVPDLSPVLAEVKAVRGEAAAAEMLQRLSKFTIDMEWVVPSQIAPEVFAFEAPEGAERVESLASALQERLAEAPSPLLGGKAPALDLELYGGGRASLADHADQVVILDFWATWCGPCIHAMPVLTSVADKYREQGLVFYAVNVQEDSAAVQAFLEQHGFKMKIPMDTEGEASRRYHVRGIPQTVIIGKDGTVQAVHVGLSLNLEEQLSREVELLLEGKNLVQ